MYAALEIKRPNGQLVALIESFDKTYKVSYAQTEALRRSLQKMLESGIIDIVNKGGEIIRFNSSPSDPDFLGKAQRYLNISYDYSCTYSFSESLPTKKQDSNMFRPVGEIVSYKVGWGSQELIMNESPTSPVAADQVKKLTDILVIFYQSEREKEVVVPLAPMSWILQI